MTPSNSNSRAPSLLADAQDCDPISSNSIRHANQAPKNTRKLIFFFVGITTLTAITALLWMLDSPTGTIDEPAPSYDLSEIAAPLDTAETAPVLAIEAPQSAAFDSAQIINEPLSEQQVNISVATPTPPVEVAHSQPVLPTAKATSPRPAARVAAAFRSSDVDVLIALMRYIESPDNDLPQLTRNALHDRVRACPAANTEAGIKCRQRICSDLPEALELCPSR